MRHTSIKPPLQPTLRFSKFTSPSEGDRTAVHWRINGYPAQILIWTAEEWERLATRPTDARYHPSGVWCALRIK